MAINSQRYFMRKEDYEEKKTPSDSPFRCFIVKCVKCDSFLLSIKGQWDEDAGEISVWLFCPRCRQQEKVNIKF
jgi:hypothetical protein